MKRPAFIVVAAPLVLTGCSYSPSIGWHWDEYSGPEYAYRSTDGTRGAVRSGFGFSPQIDIDVCNLTADGISVCAPR